MNHVFGQPRFGVRFDWGLSGARAVSQGCEVAVVVDVLSFTTTLSVAMDADIDVLPYFFKGPDAASYAIAHDAALAVGRSVAREGQISLSPSTIRQCTDKPARLVLPSPNGSTISYELAKSATTVVGASLRNAHAVASWLCSAYPSGTNVAVIAAGERWPDGSLRPAWEDAWGAGAVLDAIADSGWGAGFSEESCAARDAWTSAASTISTRLHRCVSGRELIEAGFPDDVAVAAELNASTSVPVLHGDRFVALGSSR